MPTQIHPFIRRLIQRRLDMGLSQAKLAKKAGLARATISETESGKTSPILLTLDAYARAVGLRLNLALLEEDDHPRGYVLMMDDPD